MHLANEIVGEIIAEKWKIISYLGSGKMSHVYKAQNIETGKIVALKLIKQIILEGLDQKSIANESKNFYRSQS